GDQRDVRSVPTRRSTELNGTLTVGKATLTATADNKTRVYGSSNPTLTISYAGFLNGDTPSSITQPTATTAATVGSSAGTYAITLSGGSALNYDITLVNGTLTVGKAALTARADDKSRPYNTANPLFTITYTGFLNGDNVASITAPTASTSATLSSSTGTYAIVLTGGVSVNYNFVLQNGTLTISKVTPVVSWANPTTITYGTPLSATQLNATATVPGSFSYAPGLGTILNAGVNQALSVNFTPTDAVNYNPVNGTQVFITVVKATPSVTWIPPASITYGTPLGASQLNATASVPGTFVYTPAAGTVLNAGVGQTLTVNFTPTDANNYNNVNGTSVLITVVKVTPAITWSNPSPIVYGTALSSTQLNATTTVLGNFSYTPSLGTVLNAGVNQTLSVSFVPLDPLNYNSSNASVQITVNKANPVITWPAPAPITYGTPLGPTQLNASANVPGTFVYTPTAGAIINAGVNQVLSLNFTPTDVSNYNVVTGFQRTITVNKAVPIVSWSPPLPIRVGVALTAAQLNATATVPGTFVYNPPLGTVLPAGANQVLTVDFTPTDLVNFSAVVGTQVFITVNLKDNPIITWTAPATISYGTTLTATQLNATANVPGVFVYTPAAGTLLNAGTNQTLSVTFTPTDGVTYNTISSNTQISVSKANLNATANDASRAYGQPNPTFTLSYSGFVNGESSAVIDTPPVASCTAVASSSAGSTFPIVPAGGSDNNYNFIFNNGTLTINKAALVARPDDKSRSYGLSNPSFTISFSGFVNGDNVASITIPSVSTTATTSSAVGTYPITLSGGASANYSLIFQSGTLTVTPSPLLVKADDKVKVYGQANPALSISYSGFLNGDGVTAITQPTIGTSAQTSSPVGTYPITLSGGNATNYSLILQNGMLTVDKAILTIRADDKSRVYGQINPPNTLSYSGFVNGDNIASVSPPSIVGPSASASSPVGSYPITLNGGSAANYTLNLVPGNLTITKAILTATADNQTQVYGQATPQLTFSLTGFVNGETAVVLSSQPIASTTANSLSSVGTYPISVGGGLATNYSFNYVSGALTITRANLTVTADDKNRIYGTANPAFGVSYVGFLNGDSPASVSIPPTASTSATIISPTGSYPIVVSGGSAVNYNFLYASGTLTITKATLNASADSKARAFGAANPPLTVSIVGFKNGEDISVIDTQPAAATSAVASSPIGTYQITVGGGVDNNYDFAYLPGVLTVLPGAAATVRNFSVTTSEDSPITFSYESFGANFVSVAGDSIREIKITALPSNGILTSNGLPTKKDDKIKVVKGKLDNLRFTPNRDFFGVDNFRWTMSNGLFESVPDAQVTVNVTPINDPPVLSNIEQDAIIYTPADPPILVTQALILSDVDDLNMTGASASITENYNEGDLLSLVPNTNARIVASFDKSSGKITLTGRDTKANYEKALRGLAFSTPVFTSSSSRVVSIAVSDSLGTSNTLSRKINVTEELKGIDLANAFTPNNDGKNDVWPFGAGDPQRELLKKFSEVAITIHDKNGFNVFECNSSDCALQGWDGRSGGKDLPSGPYFYTIKLNDGKVSYKGVVTILR
ncbi:MAG: gliding motility-associated C-terminal domain-containing protein, partial [Bacteroidetes bacterium]|nr:gliding motility-associated C-terminal domain-containing protein [Bacteroidota bacterium]